MKFSLKIHSSQTLRYEYRSTLYQSLNHRAVELPDRLAHISIAHLTAETIIQKNIGEFIRSNDDLLKNRDFGMHMVNDFHS